MENADKPTCRNCQKVLRPHLYNGGFGYEGEGIFCTLRCGYYFACELLRRIDSGDMVLVKSKEGTPK